MFNQIRGFFTKSGLTGSGIYICIPLFIIPTDINRVIWLSHIARRENRIFIFFCFDTPLWLPRICPSSPNPSGPNPFLMSIAKNNKTSFVASAAVPTDSILAPPSPEPLSHRDGWPDKWLLTTKCYIYELTNRLLFESIHQLTCWGRDTLWARRHLNVWDLRWRRCLVCTNLLK